MSCILNFLSQKVWLGGTFSIILELFQEEVYQDWEALFPLSTYQYNFQLQVFANSYKMPTNPVSIYKLTSHKNSIGGVIVSMLASSVVYPRISGQTKDKIKYLLLLH